MNPNFPDGLLDELRYKIALEEIDEAVHCRACSALLMQVKHSPDRLCELGSGCMRDRLKAERGST